MSEVLRQSLRPELLNRIDEVVIFRPLGREQIAQIVEIQLRELIARLQDRNVSLQLSPAARDLLAKEGFDPVYGARPLRRAIQQKIVQPLALQLLQGTFQDGDHIVVELENGDFIFQRQTSVPRAEAPEDATASP